MIVLKAIGRFFARIGRWIKETAWVQPLLIVGGIFAVIFSINPISKAIQSAMVSGNESEEYYASYQLSLAGAENGTSAVDNLISYMEGKPDAGSYPSKFFLTFVSNKCDNCASCYNGFKLFGDNFNASLPFKIDADKVADGFKLYTVFVDERNADGELLIDDLLRNHTEYFEQLMGALNEVVVSESYEYYNNAVDKHSFESNVKSFTDCIGADGDEDSVSFPTPTTLMFDKNATEPEIYGGVTEVFFNYTVDVKDSADNYNKAYFLVDAWNYKGNFTAKKN